MKNPEGQPRSWFVPLLLTVILAILIVAAHILREIKAPIAHRPPGAKPPAAGPAARKPVPHRPAGPATISLIIDDVGWDGRLARELEHIQAPLTLSLLPFAPYSKSIAESARTPNVEFMLHVPLEPTPPAQCYDKGVIKTSMNDQEVAAQFERDLAGYAPYVKGVNNHMGSLYTRNAQKMRVLLKEIHKHDLFFVDSMTASNSQGYAQAEDLGIKTARRDFFIDNTANPTEIRRELYRAADAARKQGNVVVIGHARPHTVAVLEREVPRLQQEGFRFVPVSQIVH